MLFQENLGPLYGLAKVTLNHYTKLLAFGKFCTDYARLLQQK